MKAHDYAPSGPIEISPGGPHAQIDERESALLDALDGVPLGAYDLRIIGWLARWDDSTARTVISLILRARAAGPHPDAPREDT